MWIITMDLHGVYGLLLTLIYTGQHVCSAGYTHGDRHELKSSSLTRARDRELGRAARTLLHPILSRKRRALANSEMHTLLHLHNSYRKLEGAADMELLKWNTELAEMADMWSRGCRWGHGQPNYPNAPFNGDIGQNLYAVSTPHGTLRMEDAMRAWYTVEKPNYVFNSGQCLGQICGHYTQIVWATTREIGCAYTSCPAFTGTKQQQSVNYVYLVCNYGPGGNIRGVQPYKKGPACSLCDTGVFWCDDGLCRNDCPPASSNCVCGAACSNGGCATSQCVCECQPGWTGARCTEPCQDTHQWCGAGNGWPPEWCNHQEAGDYVRAKCKHMCGLCRRQGEAPAIQCPGASTPTPVATPSPGGGDCSFQLSCLNGGLAQTTQQGCVCFCPLGWRGSQCQERVPAPTPSPTRSPSPADCTLHPCQNGGVGRAAGADCVCFCPWGWQGAYCHERIPAPTPSPTRSPSPADCTLHPCQNGGVGRAAGADCVCFCPWGWQGAYCHERIPGLPPSTTRTPTPLPADCTLHPCQNGGVGRAAGADCVCFCPWGWQGKFCQAPVGRQSTTARPTVSVVTRGSQPSPDPGCSFLPCVNGGNAYRSGNTCLCSCPSQWQGSQCQDPVSPGGGQTTRQPQTPTPGLPTDCAQLACLNGGIGGPSTSGCICFCPSTWQGTKCQEPRGQKRTPTPPPATQNIGDATKEIPSTSSPDQCRSITCHNGGAAKTEGLQDCVCFCRGDWQGTRCQESRSEATIGIIIQSSTMSIFWNDMTDAITTIIEKRLNVYCRTNLKRCCGGAPLAEGDEFDFSGGVKVGRSYPRLITVFSQDLTLLLVYARADTIKGNCRLPISQDTLLDALYPAQPDIEAAIKDCCNAELLDIRQASVDTRRRLDDVTTTVPDNSGSETGSTKGAAFTWMGLPLWLIIGIPIAVFIFLVLILVIIIMCCKRKSMNDYPPAYTTKIRTTRESRSQTNKKPIQAINGDMEMQTKSHSSKDSYMQY